ncbi:hypothetical protein Kpho02_62290 [Kitasatospora phosalacinea]|uniref:Htaa domain-containing protein n=1 Tax=Kitasatospora phosalacinea TaxID=2065 RepID=A0A9W6QEA8_9ACTN|nr:HtaA domain-containing protein [Kitasatospora phosalacinea]GLW73931.1 hypothetical protein Kpho02_62290 [Kitasatospora phosalacinea]
MPVPGRPPVPPRRPAGRLRTALALPLALLLALAWLPDRAAAADPGTPAVSGGRLDWGVKQSFLSYVTGPIAQGTWTLTGGAATVGGSVFRFHSATGSYDPATGALSAAFQGGVRFTGHRENGADALDLTVSRPTVRTTANGGAALYADVSSKSRESGRTTSTSQARLADLSLTGVPLENATGTLTLSNVPATLTSAGAAAFGGFYPAGTALDPLTFSVTLKAPAAAPSPPPAPSPTPTPPASTAPSAATTPATTATVLDRGALDWGVRRTFRDYVTGSVARGSWQPADGAADGGAFFRWTPARGTWNPATRTLDATFTGTVRFTGLREGSTLGLDLTLADPRLTTTGPEGHLTVTVSGRTPDGTTRAPAPVEIATFDASALTAENGLLSATDLPLTLTPTGANAFGHLYPAGTALDPLTVHLPLTPTATVPPLPDLGPAPSPSPADTTPTAAATPSSPSAPITALALLLTAAAATTTTVAIRRRRKR